MPAPHPISRIFTFCNGRGESILVLSTRFVAKIPSRMNGTLNYVYDDRDILIFRKFGKGLSWWIELESQLLEKMPNLISFNVWSGETGPFGFHQSAAKFESRCTSSTSTVECWRYDFSWAAAGSNWLHRRQYAVRTNISKVLLNPSIELRLSCLWLMFFISFCHSMVGLLLFLPCYRSSLIHSHNVCMNRRDILRLCHVISIFVWIWTATSTLTHVCLCMYVQETDIYTNAALEHVVVLGIRYRTCVYTVRHFE